MAIELGLRALLLAQPGIVALVPPQTIGAPTFQCVFNAFPPEGIKPPFILISQIDSDPMKAFDGTYGMEMNEFDIDCYHNTPPGAIHLANVVAAFLKDYTGMAGTDDRINAVLYNGKRHDAFFNNDGRDVRQNILSLNFEIQSTPV